MANMNIVMWTKDDCSFCRRAKSLLNSYGLTFEERKIGEGFTREQFFESNPGQTTLPQIYIQDKHVGGYTELVEYIENTGYNGTGHTL